MEYGAIHAPSKFYLEGKEYGIWNMKYIIFHMEPCLIFHM